MTHEESEAVKLTERLVRAALANGQIDLEKGEVEQVSSCGSLSDVNCPGCKAPEALKQWVVDVWEKAEHWSFSTTYEARSSDEARSLARAQYGRGYTIRGVWRGAF